MIDALKDCVGGEDNVWINMAKNECYRAFISGANAVSEAMIGNIRKQFTSDLFNATHHIEDVEKRLVDILALIQVMNDNGIISSERIMKQVPIMYKEIEKALNSRIITEQESLRRYREQNDKQED